MRYILIGLLCLGFLSSHASADDKTSFKNPEDAVSYSIGYQMGSDFKKHGLTMDPSVIAQGIRDAMQGTEPPLSSEEMHEKLVALKRQMSEAERELLKEQAEKNLAEGEAFLAANSKKEGVVVLPSGLQYQVLVEGKGESPKASDAVTVNYKGSLIDGTEFDSSYKRGQPATFQVSGVIKGWTEALQLMKPGAKWKIFLPAKLAYGERGAGRSIPPNSALIFEVELISMEPKATK